ncbi:MAG: peptidylprolyl isomerase [Thermodesulfobacteriota bacterium]|nr:peptidylprolyl isomerase [Thermodesulfobacteriota bacterium]
MRKIIEQADIEKRDKSEKESRQIIFLFARFCLALIVSFALPHSGICSDGKTPNDNLVKIVAKVNGEPIYESQVTHEVDKQLQKFQKHGMRGLRPELENKLKKNALNKIIDQHILVQASRRAAIADIEKRAGEKLESLKGDFASKEEFQQYLKAKGMTAKSLMTSTKQRIRMNEYLKSRGLAKPHVPEEEIKKFYELKKDGFKRKESVMVSHILARVAKDTEPAERRKAGERAKDLRRRVVAGKDFAVIAGKYSDCARTKQAGGDLGYIKRGFMPPGFDEVAFTLNKGEVSKVIETEFGYHIIKVVDKKPAGYVPIEDVKDFIKKYLQKGILREKIALHTKELKQKAKIEIL